MTTPTNAPRPALVVLAGGLAKRYGGCKPLAPVGLHGEAVIDLTVSDALAAGFGHVVLVLGPQTGPAIAYHVRRTWPGSVAVSFATQPIPLGTAHAVLCAREFLGEAPFAIVNADDVYGVPALGLLADHLSSGGDTAVPRPDAHATSSGGSRSGGSREASDAPHAMVAFALRDTVVTDKPVTRGTCVVNPRGLLVGIVERRKVTWHEDGRFTCADGLEPEELDASTPVSVNLWGFRPSVWPVLETAVVHTHPGVGPDGTVRDPAGLHTDVEVLLPEVIGQMISGNAPGGAPRQAVRVLDGPGRCLGVTHPEDLPVVRAELAAMTGQGRRSESPWGERQ